MLVQQGLKGGSNSYMHHAAAGFEIDNEALGPLPLANTITPMYITAVTSLLRKELLLEVLQIDLSSWTLDKPHIDTG